MRSPGRTSRYDPSVSHCSTVRWVVLVAGDGSSTRTPAPKTKEIKNTTIPIISSKKKKRDQKQESTWRVSPQVFFRMATTKVEKKGGGFNSKEVFILLRRVAIPRSR